MAVPTYCVLFLLVIVMQSTADPDFEVFKDGLLVQVNKFDKSDQEIAFLVSFLNPTEQVVKSRSLVRQFLPQSDMYQRMIVTAHDPDFVDYVRKITSGDEFRVKLYPKEQRTYTFEPEGRSQAEKGLSA